MAENKRQGSGTKGSQGSSGSASGSGMATAMVPMETALSGAIGARLVRPRYQMLRWHKPDCPDPHVH
jgi:hypothetical protein